MVTMASACERAELADAEPGAGQHLDDSRRSGSSRVAAAMNAAACVVVEELGQRFVDLGQVGPEDRVARRGVGVVPFDEPFDDHPQHAEPQADRRLLQRLAVVVLAGGEPQLVVPRCGDG